MTTDTNAAIYLRISEDREGEALGVERQKAECEALAARLGLRVVAVYEDNDCGASTRSKKRRPEYARMLADLDVGKFGTVVAYSMSRLTRRPREAEGLLERAEQRRLVLRTVASGDPDLTRADGRAMFRTLVAFDVAEAERIGERVSAAAKQRATKGKNIGGQRRFGYTADCRALVPEEAEALAFAYHLVANGGTLEAVVRDWKDRELTGSLGGKLTGVQVRDTLLRHMNAGIATYKGEVVGRTSLPAVIDEDTFWTVRETLLDPTRRTTRGRPSVTMLSSVLRCAKCGGKVAGNYRHHGAKRDFVKSAIYTCRDRHVSRVRGPLDEMIGDLVVGYLERNAEALTRPVPGRPSAALDEVTKLRGRLDTLARLVADGVLDPEDYAKSTQRVRAAMVEAEARVVSEANRTASVALVASGDVRAAWDALDTEGRRAVVKELIERIVMDRGVSGTFRPEGITVVWRASDEAEAV